ncbi:MarR family winged helix-turn-helix transcriptional regulator [Streptomyces sp. NPDC053427]|uniref:MarR family winged helix-turn-helix transcriptional regulator n=1 Tax=Streptomyces sp. NPDC053427 TaxID=3365701 RepID=UPI0037D5524F
MTAGPDPVDALMSAWRTELPEVLRPATELGKRIAHFATALDQATRRVLPELGLTVAEFDILVALRRAGAPYRMKPNELARSLLLSSGGTSNVVNHLADRGLVRREPSPDDGRSTMITLTAEGVALAERAVRANADAHEAVFADASPEAVEAATQALREVGGRRGSAPRPTRAGRNRSRS